MSPNMLLGISNISMAVLFIALAIPLMQRKVKMNKWYGIRIQKAYESEDNWYKINEYGGRTLLSWSLVLAAFGIAMFFLPLGTEEQPNETMAIIAACAPLIIMAPWVVQVLLYARKV